MSMEDQIEDHKNQLRQLIDRRFFREPRQILEPSAQRLDDWTQRLMRGLDQWLIVQKERFGGTVHQLFQASPVKKLGVLEDKRAGLHHTLIRQINSQRRLHQQRFEGLAKNLHALSPLSVLDRGYSITTHSGKAVTSASEVNKGDAVQVRLSRGKLDCTVDETLE